MVNSYLTPNVKVIFNLCNILGELLQIQVLLMELHSLMKKFAKLPWGFLLGSAACGTSKMCALSPKL